MPNINQWTEVDIYRGKTNSHKLAGYGKY